jgi:UDPglucose--hexose-1-phosphate uridylyltransferase
MNFDTPHRRYNPLNGQYVLVSPQRAKRPWLGQVEKSAADRLPEFDPTCYLCPGNDRAGGIKNPDYPGTFVFDNDFAAIMPPKGGAEEAPLEGLLSAEPESGLCRVVCFSPRHDLTIPELSLEAVTTVIQTWAAQTAQLSQLGSLRYVQVFENKGAMMGCSNPHPHSQIWATSHIPNEPAVEAHTQAEYLQRTGRCLLCDVLELERKSGERVVAQNEHFTAVVPFWAVWPFEVLVLSHRHTTSLPELTGAETHALADIYRQVTTRYDNLFEISFPYSMGFHQAPCDGVARPGWHFHAHFYPPLLRSATVKKFMVGYEMLAMPQRDLTPETAAERLRSVSAVHYKAQK